MKEFLNQNVSQFNVPFLVTKYQDGAFYVEYANESYMEISKRSPELFDNKNRILDLIHEEDRERTIKTYLDNAKDGAEFECEFRANPSLENFRWYRAVVKVRVEENIVRYFAYFLDYSSLKTRENELHAREEMQNLALSSTDINIFQVDLDKRILYLTENCKRVHDIHSDVLANFPDCLFERNYVRIDSVKLLKSMLRHLTQGEKTCEGDVWFRTNDKRSWWCEHIRFTTVFDENNIPVSAIGVGRNVTEEIKTRAEKIKFETALNNSDILLWEYDFETKTSVHHKRTADTFGIMPTVSNVPQAFVDMGVIARQSVDDYYKLYDTVRKGAESASEDIKMYDGNYNEVWYRLTLNTVFDDVGKPVRAVGSAVDLTEVKDMEDRYEGELSLQNEIIGENVIAKVRMNLTDRSIENYIAKDEFSCVAPNMDYDEAIARLANTAYLPNVRNAIMKVFDRDRLLKKFGEGKRQSVIEYKRKTREGDVVWVRTEIRCFEKPGRGDVIAFAYTYNINDDKLMQQIMSELVGTDYDYFAVIDVESDRFTFVGDRNSWYDEGGKKIKRFDSYTNTLKARVEKLFEVGGVDEACKAMDIGTIVRELNSKYAYFCTFKTRVLDGNAVYHRWNYRYLGGNKNTILCTRSNVTDIVAAEAKQKEALKNALKLATEANEAKSEFLSRMSHDMRTPMNGILGLLALTLDMDMPKEVRNNVLKMDNSSKYLLSLINDTLDMNKIESKKIALSLQPVQGRDFIENFVSSLELTARSKGVDFTTNVKLDYPVGEAVYMDKLRVQQILNNVVSNAIKFTGEGGSVLLDIHVVKKTDDKHLVKVIVSDTGCGISPEFMPKLFDAFEQEDNSVNMKTAGTGLGMSIVKSLVEMMGGKVYVESTLGKGTTVTTELIFKIADKQLVPEKKALDIKLLEGKRILICEDHPLNAEIARAILQKVGCIVTIAENGKEGLSKFEKSEINFFDFVLMDIRMPVMDGLTAASEMRKLDRVDAKTVPIVAMTANAFAADVEKSIEAGMNEHLAKPIEPMLLYQTILKFLN